LLFRKIDHHRSEITLKEHMNTLSRSRQSARHWQKWLPHRIVPLAVSAKYDVPGHSGKPEPIGRDEVDRNFGLCLLPSLLPPATALKSIIRLWLACLCGVLASVAQDAPRIELADNTSEFITLRSIGALGRGYRIDASSDLMLWSFLTSSNSASGVFSYSDPKTQATERRFYRAAETSEVLGQLRPLGRGSVRSWARLDANGTPNAIGVTFTEAALTNLPSSGLELVLTLPAAPGLAPFNHVGLNWNPQGHPPAGVYNKAHFDVHFYVLTVQERSAINSSDGGTKMYRAPDSAFLPPDYDLSPGSGDARMGSHWWDVAAPELNGQPFTHTLVYGYYDGNLTFIEPMVTVTFLKGKPSLAADIKQPAAFAKAGNYPVRYEISHSTAFREYSISLEGLTSRQASVAAPATQSLRQRSGFVPAVRDAWCGTPGSSQSLRN
jgi:Hypothetical protein TTHB210